MKVLWNLDNTVAIPMRGIKEFKIEKRDEDNQYVLVYFGDVACQRVFVGESKSKCINFIDKMEDEL